MTILDFFLSRNKNTAHIAKRRLKIIISDRKNNNIRPKYFLKLKKEIFTVICKYVKINPNMIKIQLNQKREDFSILELNIILPE
ncbi:cell division topological specificity factor MinE [Buchnera aphidicola]|uniref:cell division topological specificity factor MinE n=1 Tax=Buchnera aphidicola TaxID=9 RepID=UPI0034641245